MTKPVLYFVLLFLSQGITSLLAQLISFSDPNVNKVVCTTNSGESGNCVRLDECSHISTNPKDLTICTFDTTRGYRFCCPKKGSQTGAIQDGREVPAPAFNFTCGKREYIRDKREADPPDFDFNLDYETFPTRLAAYISAGDPAPKNSWPWMVYLSRDTGPTANEIFCGGALINHEYVLTAAHCFNNNKSPFFARFGEHEVSSDPTDTDKHEDIPRQKLIIHPEYQYGIPYFDVALVKLERPVAFREEVKPVCLPWGKYGTENLVGEFVTVTGWGHTKWGGSLSSVLQQIEVEVFDSSKCDRSYSTVKYYNNSFPKGITQKNLICAGDDEGGKDACQNDSGGPMVHVEHGKTETYTVVGVVAAGHECGLAEFPGLYAPVGRFEVLQWIKDTAF